MDAAGHLNIASGFAFSPPKDFENYAAYLRLEGEFSTLVVDGQAHVFRSEGYQGPR